MTYGMRCRACGDLMGDDDLDRCESDAGDLVHLACAHDCADCHDREVLEDGAPCPHH